MLQKSLQILKQLQHPNGLFPAAAAFSTGYNCAWIRDNVYAAIGLEKYDLQAAIKTYHALLDILLKHEYKIDWAIKEKPNAAYKYIHARYDPETLNEIYEPWGNKQNDAIGAFLFKIGQLENQGIKVLRNINDFRIIQKLIFYLNRLEYWQDPDNGIWEENEELHASSIGACLAGLLQLKEKFYVPKQMIEKGEQALKQLLPKESQIKDVDLALLSLIYPYNIISKKTAKIILKNVENNLVRNKGVIRYRGDQYYNKNGEAEWTFGFPWLAICCKRLKNKEKFQHYIKKTIECLNHKQELPELYLSNSITHNENTPLAWSQAMLLVALGE